MSSLVFLFAFASREVGAARRVTRPANVSNSEASGLPMDDMFDDVLQLLRSNSTNSLELEMSAAHSDTHCTGLFEDLVSGGARLKDEPLPPEFFGESCDVEVCDLAGFVDDLRTRVRPRSPLGGYRSPPSCG